MTTITWTPYGREETVSILYKYMARDKARGVLDEWWLCMNTDPQQESDRIYGYNLAEDNDWITIKELPAGYPRLWPKQRGTCFFYLYMTDPDTTFIRFDDDIVYVHPDAISNLAAAKKRMPFSLAVFPIIWNNSIVSWFGQKAGVIPMEFGEVGGPYCMDPVGWAAGEFAIKMHNLLLDAIRAGETEKLFLYQDYSLPLGMQFSVSCFASSGKDYAELTPPGFLDNEEESWHTIHQPFRTGRPNMLTGDSLVSHFTFYPQRNLVRATNILEQYREIARQL